MAGTLEDGLARAGLDDAPRVHHRDPLAEVPHDGEVVGDEEVAQAALGLQAHQQVEDLALYRHVQGRDRLIADDERRLEREGAGDADTLQLATGEGGWATVP